jgi:hypothetical protein
MRRPLLRIGIVAAVALVLTVTAVFAPIALRRIAAFGVRRVEVVGARYLTPAAAVLAAGITSDANLFDDPAPWLDALRAHPLVAAVTIERRVPGTLVLHIDETVPVAFARTPELRPIGANGRILPADPGDDDMDLPVLTVRTRISGQGRAVDRETLEIVRFLVTTAEAEPGLIGWVSEVGMLGDAIRLVLRNATDAEVLVTARPTAERLRELHLTLGELATAPLVHSADSTSVRALEADLSRVRRIDVRFHDQIVVALHKGKS